MVFFWRPFAERFRFVVNVVPAARFLKAPKTGLRIYPSVVGTLVFFVSHLR